MKRWTLTLALVGCLWATHAQAGLGLFKHRGDQVATIPGTTSTYPSSYSGSSSFPTASAVPATGITDPNAGGIDLNPPTRPYSYYVARPMGTARGYYGYGADQFPYYGRPYGHPYDPWTWPYMTDSYQNSLYRYYEPVLK